MANKAAKAERRVPAGVLPTHPRAAVIRFVGVFAALMAAYYALALTQAFDHALSVALRWNAWASAGLLRMAGEACRSSGTLIASAGCAINVKRGCDPVEPAVLLAAAMLAFPAPLPRKLAGIPVGIFVICAANVLRISSLFVVRARAPALFSTLHLEIWPAAMILLAGLLWIVWLGWARGGPSNAPD